MQKIYHLLHCLHQVLQAFQICNGLSNTAGVQLFLTSRGFEPGAIDGAYGDRTADAIRSYQASVGLGQTGSINDELMKRLSLMHQVMVLQINLGSIKNWWWSNNKYHKQW